MANHESAKRRIRTSAKANVRNRARRSALRTALKKVTATHEPEAALAALRAATALLDKLTLKGMIHRNTAAHRKSKLTRQVNKLTGAAQH